MAWAASAPAMCFTTNNTDTNTSPLTLQTSFCNLIKSRLTWPSSTACSCSRNGTPASPAGDQAFSVTPANRSDVDYLGQSTKGDLNVNFDYIDQVFGDDDGQMTMGGPIEEVAKMKAEEAESLLRDLEIPGPFSSRQSPRGIFCSRTLNLRSISAIGYDMDYTLMHYNVMAWEGRAYDYCMENMRNMGFPVDGLAFDPDLVIRGLVIDKEKGNLVKADRFGYVKRAMHGTTMLSNRALSEIYGRELVDLRKENRWEFLNTFFSVSEAVAYMQMVDRLDDGSVASEVGPLDYKGLYKAVGKALFRAHVEGRLKSEIMSKPDLFVEPDPELPLALLDQKEAGKKLLLITNSDYHYSDKMMQHSFNRFLPNDISWRDLFEMVIVSARKPEFFQMSHPMYEIVTGEGLMRPCFKAQTVFELQVPTTSCPSFLRISGKQDSAGDDPRDHPSFLFITFTLDSKHSLEDKAALKGSARARLLTREGRCVEAWVFRHPPPPEPPPYSTIDPGLKFLALDAGYGYRASTIVGTLTRLSRCGNDSSTRLSRCGNDSCYGAYGILFQPTTTFYIVNLTRLGGGTSYRTSRLLLMESIGIWIEIHNGSAVGSRMPKSIVMIYHSPRPPELAVGEEDVKKGKLSWLREEHLSDNQGKEIQLEQKEETYGVC